MRRQGNTAVAPWAEYVDTLAPLNLRCLHSRIQPGCLPVPIWANLIVVLVATGGKNLLLVIAKAAQSFGGQSQPNRGGVRLSSLLTTNPQRRLRRIVVEKAVVLMSKVWGSSLSVEPPSPS